MRRLQYIILFLAAAVLAFAVSCEPVDLTPRLPVIPGFENIEAEDHCIILKLDPSFAELKTKAGATESGLDSLNENRVNTIDCFFFKTGATDQPAIFRAIGRTAEDAARDSTECFVKVYYNDDIAELLFESTTEGTCEAFVIANAAVNYDPSCTVEDLRQTVLEYDFSQQEIQPYFVMCSQQTAQVTLYTTTAVVNGETKTISTAAGRVPLYRCASKIQLYLKLPETFNDGADPCVYEPCPDQLGGIRIMLKSGSKKTYAYGNYPLAKTDYISYAERPVYRAAASALVEGKTDFIYTHRPFYSYPMTWTDLDDNAANFVFSIPWRMIKDADGNDVVDGPPERRYYKISSNVIGRKFESNGYYRTFVYIQSRGDEELDKAEELDECSYIVTDWVHEGVAASSGAENISGDFIRYNFLVVEPDEVTLNNEATYTLKFKSSSDMKNYKVLIDSVCFYKYNTGVGVRTQRAVGDSVTTAAQRTSGNANFIDQNKYSVHYNYAEGEIYFTHALDEVYEQRDIYLTVTNKDEITQKVKIHQMPSIYVDTRDGDNAFIDGYFRHVKPAPFTNAYQFSGNTYGAWSGYYRSVSYYRGHGNNYNTPDSRYGWLGTSTNTGTSYYDNGSCTYVVWTPYGNMFSTPSNSNLTMDKITGVHISSFNSSNYTYTVDIVDGSTTTSTTSAYRIGDPRIANDFTGSPKLEPYLSNMNTNYNNSNYVSGTVRRYNVTRTDWGTDADKILIGQTNHAENSLIAPYLLVNSAYSSQIGTDGYGISYEEAKKKCATWQEGGYPAGRWRLPTEAEIMYIVSRQDDETIPILFNFSEGSCYWAASGYYYEQGKLHKNTNNYADGACRCVYDAWFWGDDRIQNTHIYTPMP